MKHPDAFTIHTYNRERQFPSWITIQKLTDFLHEHMHPYHDPPEDIENGIRYAVSPPPEKGGFILCLQHEEELAGVLVMLHTGMSGYVPPNLLLFFAVAKEYRSKGLGSRLIRHAAEMCPGDIKLHVEYDNPAKRLYERLGFISKYADMRFRHE
ncbi:MAG: GNAT family N-acetyltransferase [Chitinivibrionales bacterium]|nr:GNAT family N-acetyltransferase [Chitinivibrionales bacterium]